MDQMQIRQAFHDVYNGQPNIMTPHRHRYGKKGPFLYELSSGQGIVSGTIWGVTVLEYSGHGRAKRRPDLSGCYESREKAERRISRLKDHTDNSQLGT